MSAKDGLEAISILKVEDIDLVVTDLRMPGADGIEVLKQAVRINPDISVVILTAYGTLDTTLQAMKEGAYDYLTKPFKVQEIIILAERAYKRAELIDENRELTRQLRDTYRDIELIKAIVNSNNPDVALNWIERIHRLQTMNVLAAAEAEILKERLIRGHG
ncbi:MAG: response regulator [Thermodesulfovibrionales bacterium]|nr:response regulator [Thermodesulfovibrionales bacterium]